MIRLADLPNRQDSQFTLSPTEGDCRTIAADLGLLGLRKLRFDARLTPIGKRDWHLHATLGATVTQACVVSLDPVTTRIDENVERRYLSDIDEQVGDDVEIPEDDSIEPLPAQIDLAAVMIESLSLALPPYPRSAQASLDEYVVTEPGATPLTQSQLKPFAGLAGLRDQLGKAAKDTPDDGAE